MENKTFLQNFWFAYNSSRCKTAMLIISIVVTLAFCVDQLWGTQNTDLAKGFFIVMGYWVGRSSKSKEN